MIHAILQATQPTASAWTPDAVFRILTEIGGIITAIIGSVAGVLAYLKARDAKSTAVVAQGTADANASRLDVHSAAISAIDPATPTTAANSAALAQVVGEAKAAVIPANVTMMLPPSPINSLPTE